LSRASLSLGVAASVLAHQNRPLLFAKAIDDKLIVSEHDLALLSETWVWRNGISAQRGSGLSK
jgi:hypothetical protein